MQRKGLVVVVLMFLCCFTVLAQGQNAPKERAIVNMADGSELLGSVVTGIILKLN